MATGDIYLSMPDGEGGCGCCQPPCTECTETTAYETLYLDAPETGCCDTPTRGEVKTSTNPYSGPAKLCVTGGANDEIIINGSIYEEGEHSACWAAYGITTCGTNLNCAHSFAYTAQVEAGAQTTFQCQNNCSEGGGYVYVCYTPTSPP